MSFLHLIIRQMESDTPESKIKFFQCTEDFLKEAEEIIEENETKCTEFTKQKLEKEAGWNWNKFYQRNTTNFFKDRHYLLQEFSELETASKSESEITLLDVGCGVGNALFPLCSEIPHLKVNGFDFA